MALDFNDRKLPTKAYRRPEKESHPISVDWSSADTSGLMIVPMTMVARLLEEAGYREVAS